MVAQPGRLQAAFTAGEIDQLLHDRTELKYFGTGALRMENVVIHPQGGFRLSGGLVDIGEVSAAAARLFPFTASDGEAYDIVFEPGQFSTWSATGKLQDVPLTDITAAMLPDMTAAQQSDTMLVFHEDLEPRRIIHAGATSWSTDIAPLTGIPNYDYGGTYTNGVSAAWTLEFIGLDNNSVFILTISQQETVSIRYTTTNADLITRIDTAISELPNINPGYVVADIEADPEKEGEVEITFSGDGNEGDGWAVSGRVVNAADAAVLSAKSVVGVAPGEPLISPQAGWPSCGTFYTQRLLLGGFKSLPGAWMFSKLAEYFNFDDRFEGADGPALIPMDAQSGEKITHLVASRNLSIFTTDAEYWIAERGLSKTDAPNHVQASVYGTRTGVPVVQNEGGLIFINDGGGVMAEFRYTDVEGNFVSRDISLLGSHLFTDIVDQASRNATLSTDANQIGIVQGDGTARIATILREQDVTAFARRTTDGTFKAVSVNGRNEMMFITDRPDSRRLERLDPDILLDEATNFDLGVPGNTITGLSRFNGREIWIIGDNEVIGPMTVADGQVTIPFEVTSGYVGTWTPPIVTTLPPPRTVGPNTVLRRPARIHTAHISVVDTTSLAIASHDGVLREVPLHRYGVEADVAELEQGVTGVITVRGLRGFVDEPTITVSQLRPGKMTVRSITLEAKL